MNYWVGELYVDLPRNQITIVNETITMAPKALSVLTLLAENQGSVVSQEQILNDVWKDTIVTPNTLQRSIAQLRKAFNDDAKQQKWIKTHAKKGYSLELSVRWDEQHEHDVVEGAKLEANAPVESISFARKLTYATLAGLAFLAMLTALVTPFKPEPLLSITAIQPLTATDNKELGAIYTNNAEFIVFKRYHMQMCNSQIWAKNPATQQEYLLTPEWGNYGGLAFSPDDTKLAFIQKESCQANPIKKPRAQHCYNLKEMDFQQAIAGEQAISTMMSCSNAEIKRPFWLNDKEIVLMHRQNFQWQLLKYKIEEDSSEVLYQAKNGNMRYYDYSASKSLFAISKLNEDNQPILDIVNKNGELISSNLIEEHPSIPKYRLFRHHFIPNKSLLTFGVGRQIFSLTYDGKVEHISLPLDQPMGTLLFNKQGNKALATKGVYDDDIGTFVISENKIEKFNNIARTNTGESMAQFSPDGSKIVFGSRRTGSMQLWLNEEGKLKQLTDFGMNSLISSFLWSDNGQELLVNSDGQLFIFGLTGIKTKLQSPEPVQQIFHWDNDTNKVIVNMLDKGQSILAEINLSTNEHIKLKDASVLWADKSTSGDIIYLDSDFRIWQFDFTEDTLIDALVDQSSDKQFIVSGNTIIGVNNDYQLWTLALDTREFKLHNQLPKNVDYLTDFHNNTLLVSYVIAAKKEIVEVKIGG